MSSFGSQGRYLPFFFLAAFFFFLATVHPPLKVRQPAAVRCALQRGREPQATKSIKHQPQNVRERVGVNSCNTESHERDARPTY